MTTEKYICHNTMDRNPLSNLENGYQMMHLFDFLLNDQALETV